MAWQVICSAREVVADEIKECRLADGANAIAVRLPSGEVKVFQGMCPHQRRSLADGDLYGDVLTCGAHMWEFDLQTGQGLNGTPVGLAAYPTKIENDDVLVDGSLVEPVARWR